jgi:hypothetical protein
VVVVPVVVQRFGCSQHRMECDSFAVTAEGGRRVRHLAVAALGVGNAFRSEEAGGAPAAAHVALVPPVPDVATGRRADRNHRVDHVGAHEDTRNHSLGVVLRANQDRQLDNSQPSSTTLRRSEVRSRTVSPHLPCPLAGARRRSPTVFVRSGAAPASPRHSPEGGPAADRRVPSPASSLPP